VNISRATNIAFVEISRNNIYVCSGSSPIVNSVFAAAIKGIILLSLETGKPNPKRNKAIPVIIRSRIVIADCKINLERKAVCKEKISSSPV